MMTLEERAQVYNRQFPKYPPMHVANGWLYGFWMIGREWKKNPSPIYGGYPGNYLPRIRALFPEIPPERTLHLFKGAVNSRPGEFSIDLNPQWEPTHVANAELPLPFDRDAFDVIYADPPYSKADAKHYGLPMVNRKKVLAQARNVLTPGGFLVWLDTMRPMYRADVWTQVGIIGVLAGTNCRARAVSIFQRMP